MSVIEHCEECNFSSCVWLQHRRNIVQNDIMMYSEDIPVNKRRKNIFQNISIIINGGPLRKGNRIQHPTCVEDGV